MILKNKEKINKRWCILTVLMLLTTNLLVVRVLGYPVVLMFVLLPYWFYITFEIVFVKRYNIWFLFFAICLIPFINYSDVYDWSEFFKTYSQLVMNAFFLLFFCYSQKTKINRETVMKALNIAQNIILLLTVIQTFEFYYLSTKYFWNIFGDLTSLNEIARDYKGEGFRAKAMYHEPSHLGLIMVFIFFMKQIVDKKLTVNNFIKSTTVIVLAKSSLGYLVFPIATFIFLRYYFRGFRLIIFYLTLTVVGSIIVINYSNQILESTKINEALDTEKVTSGYMRWGLPLAIIEDQIKKGQIYGHGLGQISTDYFWMISPMLEYENVEEASISNGLLSAIIELGIFFILFLCYVFFYKFWKLNRNWRAFTLLNLIALTGSTYLMVQSYFICFYLPILVLKVMDNEVKYNYSL